MSEISVVEQLGRILVVDDTIANLQLLMNILSEQGYTVHPASDGGLALRFVQSVLPDLILLDINMPGMDGFELCRRLKADARTSSIPIIFISILEDSQDKLKAFQVGGVDYINKPFKPEEVLARVRTHVRLRDLTVRLEQIVHERTEELAKSNERLVREINERTRAEKERKLLHEQLHQAQKMESVGRLAGGVAHDFNNMLAVVLGYAEMSLMKLDPAHPLYYNLQAIGEAAERSKSLVRQLLAFARKQTIAPQVLDLNEIVEGMLMMLGRLISEEIKLIWTPGRGLWPVRMDPSQLDQVLINLCVNARDAISGVGKVTIETATATIDEYLCCYCPSFVPGEYVLLTVSDDGCGMDKETQDKIFEPFFTTKGLGKGTGLGLSTVYGIVRQNNGFINVYSEPGKGTIFKIYLPRHEAENVPAKASVPKAVRRGNETILLVEDEPQILEIGMIMLGEFGYTVLSAATPNEAFRLAEEHAGEIHLLVTDVVMPKMNGCELAQRLTCLYPDLKCLFMSGYTADVIAQRGELGEGVNFIQKPFSMPGLAAKVRQVMDKE